MLTFGLSKPGSAFGNTLRELRLSRHLSQIKLSKSTELADHSYISKLERASRVPDRETVDRLVAGFAALPGMALTAEEIARLYASIGYTAPELQPTRYPEELVALNDLLERMRTEAPELYKQTLSQLRWLRKTGQRMMAYQKGSSAP